MPSNQPNIILITTDQQRHDTCGPLAPPFMRTPHFDNIARQGVSFSKAYTDCPICVAARTSLMTGKFVFTHGNAANGYSSEYYGRENTLPTCLRSLGYQTIAIGKMHFMPQRTKHGFDEMILPDDYYRWIRTIGSPYLPMRHGLGQNELHPGMATVPESLTLTSWIAEQCVSYIRDRRDPSMPFFLWCSFPKPHPPLDPPEPYYSMYRNCDIPKPVYGDWCDPGKAPIAFDRFRKKWSMDKLTPEIIREARAAYYGLITQNDYNMGRVFAALVDMGLFDDSMILFTSDHGEFLGDHRTGAKCFFHEPSAHVPFVLRLPQSWQNRQHNTTCEHPVTLADILPTFVRAAGGTPPADADGQDLVAVARGEIPQPRKYVHATMSNHPYVALTDGKWKYIWYPQGPTEQLFELVNDPQELRDLAKDADHRQKKAELQNDMIRWHTERNTGWVVDGKLRVDPVTDVTENDLRANSWPGYHTDYYDIDVRH